MVYSIISKRRYEKKLERLLIYLEDEFGLLVAKSFATKLDRKLKTLQKQPYIGKPSDTVKDVRSIMPSRHNRIYYKIFGNEIIIINMYDTRMNPRRNRYK
jgi:plasmid stabilization system protein ParE